MKFVKDIDDDVIVLLSGRGNQIGTYPISDFYKYVNIDPRIVKKMQFTRVESQKIWMEYQKLAKDKYNLHFSPDKKLRASRH